jgi:1-deoxy-D-xylulose-5-phosphate reductoisomerase
MIQILHHDADCVAVMKPMGVAAIPEKRDDLSCLSALLTAQLGTPDMRGPIAYGLSWPHRVQSGAAAIDFSTVGGLTFEPMNTRDHQVRFPGLALAWQVLEAPIGTTAVLNAANEVAVAAFLDERVRFDEIHRVNCETLEAVKVVCPQSLRDLLELDAQSRRVAHEVVSNLAR